MDTSIANAKKLRKIHNPVHGQITDTAGPFEKGHTYTANELQAVKWVFATLMENVIFAHELFNSDLSQEEKDEYMRFASSMGYFFGLGPGSFPDNYKE